ncbi:unnamed protein product [Protopolystoma xenopodis]|uniref:Uncharacterized protein n=1 Tax=Protopolystoma xenopodis TaxID=117903 RepID=A0A448XBP3_9PLAT|nr:unnamed protein product [Protopolystoma xenopodis]
MYYYEPRLWSRAGQQATRQANLSLTNRMSRSGWKLGLASGGNASETAFYSGVAPESDTDWVLSPGRHRLTLSSATSNTL